MNKISMALTRGMIGLSLSLTLCVQSVFGQASPLTINLGTAATFGILSAAGITGTGAMTGNIGTLTGSIGIGITATGTIYPVGDTAVTTARADLLTAYNDAAGRSGAITVGTELGAQTLTAGVYKSDAGTFGMTGTLTLDAQNNPDAIFIFQMGSTLTTAAGSSVNLINGARMSNIFWQVGSSATLGANSVLEGTILANTSITANNNATVHGRLLAGAVISSGAVTVDAVRGADTHTITATSGSNGSISPSGAVNVAHGLNQTFTFTASTTYHVADVLVDGISVGAVTSYTFTNVTAIHTIAASFAINTYTISATAGANGAISPSGTQTINSGASATFTITPNSGYHIADVLVDGVSVGAVASYTFTNVTANHTIAASFAINTYTIMATVGANGSISPSGVVNVNHGLNQTFTITANAGYHVANVLVDGDSVGAVTSYTFSNITASHTIAAAFAINAYAITATAGANGSVSPSGVVNVNHGLDQAFTFTASTGYHVADVLVDSVSVGAVTSYSFSGVTTNHTVAASFAVNVYTITATAGANGSVSPSGVVNVNHGLDQTFTFTASTGYHVADVLVDGISVGAVTSYSFPGVTTNHTVAVSFAVNAYTIAATAGANGSISPSGVVNVNHGLSRTFTMTPGTGYHVADVLVDGVSVSAVTSYTFTNVTANHTISASFAITTFTVAPTAGANGTITPSGVQTVDYGTNRTFAIVPSTGCHVADVLVDGVSVGAVTSYTFNNVTASHTIAATFAINTFTITASAGLNGAITPTGGVSVDYGSNQSFTVTPSPGYHVANVLADGISMGAVASYTFSNVTASHTIAATYAINTFTITASAGLNGTITPTGGVSVNYGTNQSFTVTPSTGYHVADVSVDGVSGGALTSYTFTNVTATHTISASFAINTFSLTANAGLNGTITPTGSVSVNYGANQSFTVTPTTGYHVADVLVDGVSVGAGASYTFTNVTADHVISASFFIDAFTITASAGLNGAVTPTGSLSLNYGTDQLFNIAPNPGYHVADVLVDGVSVGAVTGYTFTNVTATHTIAATFAVNTPAAPFLVTPADAAVNILTSPALSWNASTGAATYRLQVSTSNTFATTVYDNATLTGLSQPITGLTTGTTYYWRANAKNVNGTSAYSAVRNFTTIAALPASPVLVTPVDAAVNILTSPTLIWNASTGAVTYHLQVSTSTLFTTTVHDDSTITGTSQAITGLAPGAIYYWRVNAKNTGGTTTYSPVWSFTTVIPSTVAVTSSPAAGGTTSGGGTFNSGSSVTVAATANDGYAFTNWTVGPTVVSTSASYSFSVTGSRALVANFQVIQHTIMASAGLDGTITPTGGTSVSHGADQTFNITPGTGYQVANVLVDGVSAGAVTSYTFINVTVTHTISATFAIRAFTITASASLNGTITPTGTISANFGANQTFAIAPSTGYRVADVSVDGISVGAVTNYTFTNAIANHTISASFAITAFTITPTAGANGIISPAGIQAVNSGGSQSFTITPTSGYHIADVLVDGASVGAGTSYTFANVTANHTIATSFAVNTYAVTASAGANGAISPSGIVDVTYGFDQTFTITPNATSQVADVLVDGNSVGKVTSFTFSNVAASHTITASFAVRAYSITATAGANGSVSPSGAVNVIHGLNQTFTITPSTGYHVADVLVDGISVGAVTSCSFSNVTTNHTVAASFAINAYAITATAGANGSISPSGDLFVTHGLGPTFTFTADIGYHLADVSVDGISVGAVTSYSFSNVTTSHTIVAAFAIDTYTITSSAGVNGSISSPGVVGVGYGSSRILTITPGVGYHVADVLVDGISVGAVTSYTFTNITASHTIAASFAVNTYTIMAIVGANGTISPNGTMTANYGAIQNLLITPNTGYRVLDVLVDGISVGAMTNYTFTNVTANHTITASFAINTYSITSTSNANGSISPNGTVTVDYNSRYRFTMIPNPGNHIDSLLVDGVRVDSTTSYTFMNVTGNHRIRVVFGILTLVMEFYPTVPNAYNLFQNYPNPFNPSTKIQYSLEKAGMVSLKVYSVLGNEVATLVNAHQQAGTYIVSFSTAGGSSSGGHGSRLASGVYFYRIQTGSFVSIKKLVLMK